MSWRWTPDDVAYVAENSEARVLFADARWPELAAAAALSPRVADDARFAIGGDLPGFRPWARTYPGYSADFFDGEHDVVFGASWATDRSLLRPSFRNWYRRSYPYAFTKFRVVRSP